MIEIRDYKVYNIVFDHDDVELDETSFDIRFDTDEADSIMELMNLFNEFIKENNYTNVRNISTYIDYYYEVKRRYVDGNIVVEDEVVKEDFDDFINYLYSAR